MKKSGFLFVLFYFFAVIGFAQSPQYLWASYATSDSGWQEGVAVAADPVNPYAYSAGFFLNSSATFGNITLNFEGSNTNIFLVKYDSTGRALWGVSASGDSTCYLQAVAADGRGNVFIAGYYFGYFLHLGNDTLYSNGHHFNYYLAKYDSSGNLLWARTAHPNGANYIGASSVACDTGGNVYVTGSFSGIDTFGNTILTATGTYQNMFLIKFDTNGNVVWANTSTGGKTSYADGVSCARATGDVFIGLRKGLKPCTFSAAPLGATHF